MSPREAVVSECSRSRCDAEGLAFLGCWFDGSSSRASVRVRIRRRGMCSINPEEKVTICSQYEVPLIDAQWRYHGVTKTDAKNWPHFGTSVNFHQFRQWRKYQRPWEYHGGPHNVVISRTHYGIVPMSVIARFRLDSKLIASWFSRWIFSCLGSSTASHQGLWPAAFAQAVLLVAMESCTGVPFQCLTSCKRPQTGTCLMIAEILLYRDPWSVLMVMRTNMDTVFRCPFGSSWLSMILPLCPQLPRPWSVINHINKKLP